MERMRNDQSLPLLRTKLYAPPLREGLVRREVLHKRLHEAFERRSHLTLISAPAGYGKTTLIREWIEQEQQPYAWFSLDPGDNDPVRFLTYLIAALQEAVNHLAASESGSDALGESVQLMLRTPQLPPIDLLMTLLINDLMDLPTTVFLVLDDYQLIQNQQVHQAIQFFLDHQPPKVHLVLTTRQDPPLTLARLRMQNLMSEVRVNELRFSLDEIEQFLHDTVAVHFPPEVLTALESRTEGWIAGLQLVGLALRGLESEAASSFVDQFSGSHRFMTDYLFEEVLRLQPEEVRDFLHQTSVLPRLCAPLCDRLTGRTDSKEMLARLDKANLFVIALDDHQQWYRYHHLFAEYLQSELDSSARKRLHLQAAHWFETNHLLIESVQHALAADENEEAMRLMGQAAQKLLETGGTTTFMEWFEMLPQESIRTNPEMSVLRAWSYYIHGQMTELDRYLISMEEAWEHPPTERDRGRLLCLRSYVATNKGLPGSFALAEESVTLISEDDPLFRTLALLAFGQEQCLAGAWASAIETFREAVSFGQRLGMPFSTLLALNYLTENLFKVGRLQEARAICQRVMDQYADRNGHPTPIARMTYLAMARIYLACNDLPTALEYAQEGLAFGRNMGMVNLVIDGEVTLVNMKMIHGEWEEALAAIRQLQQMATQINLAHLNTHLTTLEADLYLKRGDLATARTLLEKAGLNSSDVTNDAGETRYYTLIRLSLAAGDWTEAQHVLERLEAEARKDGRYGNLIPICIWQAIAAQGLQQNGEAEAYLAEALRLAAPEEYLRPFVEEGEQLFDLLPQVRHLAPTFVDRVMAAIAEEQHSQVQSGVQMATPGEIRNPQHRVMTAQAADAQELEAQIILIEPLSEREIEILQHVSAGLSNQDIAQKLCITVGTVKWHLANIYSKLDVKRRTQAVEIARKLRLI